MVLNILSTLRWQKLYIFRGVESTALNITLGRRLSGFLIVQIQNECDQGKLTALQQLLGQTEYEEIQYDKQYIMSTMGWTAAQGLPAFLAPQIPEPDRNAAAPDSSGM